MEGKRLRTTARLSGLVDVKALFRAAPHSSHREYSFGAAALRRPGAFRDWTAFRRRTLVHVACYLDHIAPLYFWVTLAILRDADAFGAGPARCAHGFAAHSR